MISISDLAEQHLAIAELCAAHGYEHVQLFHDEADKDTGYQPVDIFVQDTDTEALSEEQKEIALNSLGALASALQTKFNCDFHLVFETPDTSTPMCPIHQFEGDDQAAQVFGEQWRTVRLSQQYLKHQAVLQDAHKTDSKPTTTQPISTVSELVEHCGTIADLCESAEHGFTNVQLYCQPTNDDSDLLPVEIYIPGFDDAASDKDILSALMQRTDALKQALQAQFQCDFYVTTSRPEDCELCPLRELNSLVERDTDAESEEAEPKRRFESVYDSFVDPNELRFSNQQVHKKKRSAAAPRQGEKGQDAEEGASMTMKRYRANSSAAASSSSSTSGRPIGKDMYHQSSTGPQANGNGPHDFPQSRR